MAKTSRHPAQSELGLKTRLNDWTAGIKGLTLLLTAVAALIVTTILGISKIRAAYQASSHSLAKQQGVIVGEIRAFASSTPPDGWLEANGDQYQKAALPTLYQAIGTAWGIEDTRCFNVPDLRGQFLRGWNHDRPKPNSANDASYLGDPDADQRTGDNRVGSTQTSAFRRHDHALVANKGGEISGGSPSQNYEHYDYARAFGAAGGVQSGLALTSPVGEDETRPVNSYVLFAIYAGPEATGTLIKTAPCHPRK